MSYPAPPQLFVPSNTPQPPLPHTRTRTHALQLAKRQKLNAALKKDVAVATQAVQSIVKKKGAYPLVDKVGQLKQREEEALELTNRAKSMLGTAGGGSGGGGGGGSATAPTPRAAVKGAKRAITTQGVDDLNKLAGRLGGGR